MDTAAVAIIVVAAGATIVVAVVSAISWFWCAAPFLGGFDMQIA